MKSVAAYVLYGDNPRYWRLAPLLYLAGRLLKPGLITRWYMTEDTTRTPGATLLHRLASEDPRLEISVIPGKYLDQEPAAWRMRPLWDADVDLFFIRDADSLPCTYEIKAERVFLASGFMVHGMKTHPHHVDDLLAGLSGFKAEALRTSEKAMTSKCHKLPGSYDEWASGGLHFEWRRWTDQFLLRNTFIHWRPDMLVSRTNGAPLPAPHPRISGPVELPDDVYARQDLPDVHKGFLNLCDTVSTFPGAQLYAGVPHGEPIYGRYGHRIGSKVVMASLLAAALRFEAPAVETLKRALYSNSSLKKDFEV